MEIDHNVKFFGHSHCTQQAKYRNTDKSILSSKLRSQFSHPVIDDISA
jgi:hypothetical protein